MTRYWLWVLALAGVAMLGSAGAQEVSKASDSPMTQAGNGDFTDPQAALAYLRQRTLSVAEKERVAELLRQLNANSFVAREQASAELTRLGSKALDVLRLAVHDPNPEVAGRARHCLEQLPNADKIDRTHAALETLKRQPAPEAVLVLLAFLAGVADETVQEETAETLAIVGVRGAEVAPRLLAAAGDADPVLRLAAAMSLPRSSHAAARTAARRLLADPHPRVRYQAARQLARAGDETAVATLIALLKDAPLSLAWQAEDVLCQLAGDPLPAPALTLGTAQGRAQAHAAWEKWWASSERQIDLTKLADTESRVLGLTIVCDCDVSQSRLGRVWELDGDGKTRWQIDDVRNPADTQLLPNGRLLIAECQGHVVTERDRNGRVWWQYEVKSNPVSCQRLTNGNTFIATYHQLLEVTRDGQIVMSRDFPGSIYCAQKLRNGHILYVHSNGNVVELDALGKETRVIPIGQTSGWASVEALPGNRYLIAQYTANRVVEVDESGKVLWECAMQTPAWATRLANGQTLVASPDGRCVAEFDRAGKQTWRQPTAGRPFRVLRR
ncbi:MAG: HEAT repeat domain-containing protein [Gemmataceae bacterium]